jgi:hypothetical protein
LDIQDIYFDPINNRQNFCEKMSNEVKLFGKWNFKDVTVEDLALKVNFKLTFQGLYWSKTKRTLTIFTTFSWKIQRKKIQKSIMSYCRKISKCFNETRKKFRKEIISC